jgi:hypothetical protein
MAVKKGVARLELIFEWLPNPRLEPIWLNGT